MSPQSEPVRQGGQLTGESTPAGDKTDAGTQTAQEWNARLAAERKRHQDELKQFAYAVSHDLREPIRMIVSYAQLLDRRYQAQLDGDGRDFMGYIVDASQRMDRLLSDLLTYSHQFRPLEQPLESVNAEAALEGAALMIDKAVRENGARITHDPLPSVAFDFAQLTQVFRQLLSNSILFRGSEPPEIHIAAKEADEAVQFSIRDNGIGIDPKYHEQIFGVFKRLHGREVPGTGIGLAIVKRIVDQRGGKVWVESEAGKGAVFHFTVPH